jgi:ATP-dependent Lon protease
LRGRVLPIGGLKEKILAAKRAKLTTVILPKRNKKDLEDIPKHLLKGLHLAFVETMDDVLKVGLRKSSPAKSPAWSVTNGRGRKRRAQPPAIAPAKRANRPRPRPIAPSVSVHPRLTH